MTGEKNGVILLDKIFNHFVLFLVHSISSAAALALASASTPATTLAPTTANSPSAYWCFDAYRRGDVYSYALVMWEVMSRTLITSGTDDGDFFRRRLNESQQQQSPDINQYNPYVYRAPYQDRGVGWDPGFDDMRNIVCSTDPILSRPGVAPEWQTDQVHYFIIHYFNNTLLYTCI